MVIYLDEPMNFCICSWPAFIQIQTFIKTHKPSLYTTYITNIVLSCRLKNIFDQLEKMVLRTLGVAKVSMSIFPTWIIVFYALKNVYGIQG